MAEIKTFLDALDPRLFWIVISLVVLGVIQLWRWVHPASFDKVPARIKALPAVALGAILAATASDDVTQIVMNLVIGALSGVGAVGAHETVRRLATGESNTSPIPRGSARPPTPS
jgi:hypothetical protein